MQDASLVWVVNGYCEKADASFRSEFHMQEVADNVYVGSYPDDD